MSHFWSFVVREGLTPSAFPGVCWLERSLLYQVSGPERQQHR